MRSLLLALAVLAAFPALRQASVSSGQAAQTRTAKSLDIYVVDVEGGNATLFVSPSGESVLIDTGNAGAAAVRDAGRIMAAVKDAGVTQIDHLITTHWHGDHFGGMAELAARIPIRRVHRSRPERAAGRSRRRVLQKTYPDALREGEAHRRQAGRQDRRSRASTVRIVTSAGETIKTPLARRRASRIRIARASSRRERHAEDPQSVGSLRHLRKIPHGSSGRPDQEQGIRADVPEQPHRHGGCAARVCITGRPSRIRRCWCTRCIRASPS